MISTIAKLYRCLFPTNCVGSTYRELSFREPGTPGENSERLLESVAQDFDLIRQRTDAQNLFVGRFFGTVLLIERKLVQSLERFCPAIEGKTFGTKLGVFKDFLNELDQKYEIDGIDSNDYRAILGPLNEVKNIRDAMTHNLSKVSFSLDEVRQTSAYLQRKRPDLYDAAMSFESLEDQSQAIIAGFGFVISVDLAFIDHLFV